MVNPGRIKEDDLKSVEICGNLYDIRICGKTFGKLHSFPWSSFLMGVVESCRKVEQHLNKLVKCYYIAAFEVQGRKMSHSEGV